MGAEPRWYDKYLSQIRALMETGEIDEEEAKKIVGRHSAPADATALDEGAKEGIRVIGEMTLDGVVLEVFSILKRKEQYIEGDEMANRSQRWGASAGKEDRRLVQDNTGDIPDEFADKVFVFCDERHPDDPGYVAVVCRGEVGWLRRWGWLGDPWRDGCVFVRRK